MPTAREKRREDDLISVSGSGRKGSSYRKEVQYMGEEEGKSTRGTRGEKKGTEKKS